MATDWAADVRKYAPKATDEHNKGIVRHCGIALQKADSSLVSCSDKAETDRVKNGFMKKKLALTDDDATLQASIDAVCAQMKASKRKNRVTFYYLLAERHGKLDLFG